MYARTGDISIKSDVCVSGLIHTNTNIKECILEEVDYLDQPNTCLSLSSLLSPLSTAVVRSAGALLTGDLRRRRLQQVLDV